jgi:DNA-binding cell septation regulator SpoVG
MSRASPADIGRGNAFLTRKQAAAAVKIVKLVPHRSGSMLAFLAIETTSGLILHDLRLMAGRNGAWVAMPSKPQIDRDGQPRLDENGRQTYSQIVEFRDRATADKFRDQVIDAIQRQHPEVIEEDGASLSLTDIRPGERLNPHQAWRGDRRRLEGRPTP